MDWEGRSAPLCERMDLTGTSSACPESFPRLSLSVRRLLTSRNKADPVPRERVRSAWPGAAGELERGKSRARA